MEYDNTNSGVLFKNRDKETDKHPDYTGKLNVNGTELRIAAWIRESKSGQKFMSLKVSEPTTKAASKPETRGFDDIVDDVPF